MDLFYSPSRRTRRATIRLLSALCATLGLLPSLDSQAQSLTTTNGLQLWLKADAGITTNATGAVTGWADQSGKSNHAAQTDETAAPAFTAAALNGKPAVHFDGSNDYLDIASAPSIEITGDISSFFVVEFDDFADYRAVWGKTLVNIPASTDYYIAPPGTPRVYRGSGDVSDIGAVDSTFRPRAGNFSILGFQMAGTTLTHYLNTQPVGSGEITATLVDGATPLKIGSRDDLFTKMKGHIAELLIYDKSLAGNERNDVVNYLQTKYGITNQPPTIALTAPSDSSSITIPGTITISANATDSDGTISKVDFFANGSLVATATAPPYKALVAVHSPGTIVFTAVATDNKDATATSAPITVTASGTVNPSLTVTNGLQLWLKADSGITKHATGLVTAWADQSGQGNNALQADTTMAPVFSETGLGGKPALHFDGDDDYLNVTSSPSIAITGDIASFFVVRFDDFATYRAVWGKTAANVPRPTDYYLLPSSGIPRVFRGSDETGVNQFVDGAGGVPTNAPVLLGFSQTGTVMTHYVNGQPFGSGEVTVVPTDSASDLKIGTRDDFVTKMRGHIGELLLFDRGVTAADASAIASYLGGKYGVAILELTNNPPTVALMAPAASGSFNAPTNVTLTATASDPDGGIARVEFFADGAFIGAATSSPYQAKASLSLGGDIVLTAVAVDNLGTKTTSSPVTIHVNSTTTIPLPATAALRLWLRADVGVATDASGSVTNWADFSGHGFDAAPLASSQAPTLQTNVLNALPAIHFDGDDDYLQVAAAATLGLTRDITSFFVVKVEDFDTYRAIWSKTDGSQPRPFDYYVLPNSGVPRAIFGGFTAVGSADASEPMATNEFAIIGFELNAGKLTHYYGDAVKGTGTISAPGDDAGTSLLIGTRADFVTRLKGSLAELIIYNAGLNDVTRGQVVAYLNSKYFGTSVGGPTVAVRRATGNVVVEWSSGGQLEEASSISGPWTQLQGAASPFSIAPSGQQKFYRVRQ